MSRKTAAAVPASKVEIGRVYAIQHDDKLVRFTVTAVITRRESNHGNPHDFKSTVEGTIPEQDNDGKPLKLTVPPSALLGLYTEHVELVERQKVERAAAEAAKQAHTAKTKALYEALYEAAGIEPPETDRDFSAPIRVSYGKTSIEIADKGIAPLLAFFERVKQSA